MTTSTASASYARPDYTEALSTWAKNRAACKGEAAVKLLESSLPYINAHDETPANVERNAAYRMRASWFNASGRTLSGLIGLAFRKDPRVNLGSLKYLLTNADGAGTSLYGVAQLALSGVLQTARHGLLVDVVNGRPSVIGYDAESIINWRVSVVNDKRVLSLLVLEENIEEETDFELKTNKQWRVYRLVDGEVTLTVFKENISDDKKTKTVDAGTAIDLRMPVATNFRLKEIPFFFIGPITNSPDIQEAPLQSLIDTNYAHFRNSADYEDSVFYVGQAQPWISGLSEEWRDFLINQGMYVGSRAPLLLPENGAFGIEQAQPNSIAHEAMTDKEKQMVSLGARLVEMGTITKTATQAAGDIASSNSVLTLCCANTSDAIIAALKTCGLFQNGRPFEEADFRITQDYLDLNIDAGMLTALVKSWQAGAFAKTDLYAYLRKGQILDQERTDQDIDSDIEANPPLFIDSGVNGDINPGNAGAL